MKKIVFFDIDGTLLDHEKKLPDSTKEAITQLKNNGVFVAIATGRAPFMFKELREELDIDSYVCFNGQYVVFENEVIYTNPLNQKEIERLIDDSQKNQHPLVFLNEEQMTTNTLDHPFVKVGMESLKIVPPEFNPSFYKDKEIYQALLFCEERNEDSYLKNYKEFHFIRWHDLSMDVIPSGGSKAEGIKKLIKKIGFNINEVFAFGDGLNDIEMLKAVGTGIAMGNASETVKEYADYITTDVSESGIYNGLRHFNLIV